MCKVIDEVIRERVPALSRKTNTPRISRALGEFLLRSNRGRIYLSDIEDITQRTGVMIGEVRDVVEALADRGYAHYASFPDSPVPFDAVPPEDYELVLYAYVLPPDLLPAVTRELG